MGRVGSQNFETGQKNGRGRNFRVVGTDVLMNFHCDSTQS